MKYNLGSGEHPLDGYINIDRKQGGEAFPLDIPDDSADEIRASHVLEHFEHGMTERIVKHWASKLKPGGVLKIAVPDFDVIAKAYLEGSEAPIEGYVMGGQVDDDDFHKSLFNAGTLTEHFRAANLTDIARWDSDAPDCSRLPISLNLRAVKPARLDPGRMPSIVAVMSLPRTHWTANFRCAEQLVALKVPLQAFEGVYWGQCLERGLDKLIADGIDFALAIDYDTVYTAQNVQTLLRLMLLHPEADAICALQSARGWNSILATVRLPDGTVADRVSREILDADLMPLHTGHFGLTLIRLAALKTVPKPWFLGVPAKDGSWGEGHVDEDIHFWRRWAEAGKTLFAANRVAVGHIEPMIKWPGRNLGSIYQRVPDYWNAGPPKDVWK